MQIFAHFLIQKRFAVIRSRFLRNKHFGGCILQLLIISNALSGSPNEQSKVSLSFQGLPRTHCDLCCSCDRPETSPLKVIPFILFVIAIFLAFSRLSISSSNSSTEMDGIRVVAMMTTRLCMKAIHQTQSKYYYFEKHVFHWRCLSSEDGGFVSSVLLLFGEYAMGFEKLWWFWCGLIQRYGLNPSDATTSISIFFVTINEAGKVLIVIVAGTSPGFRHCSNNILCGYSRQLG